MKQTKPWLGNLMLFTCTIIWGSSFVIMKNTLDVMPAFPLLGIRFSVAFVLMAVVFWRKWKLLNKKILFHGFLCGLFVGCAYVIQTIGLQDTTPGKNAFLSAVYCVLTPFIAWVFVHKKPHIQNWVAAVMSLIGVGLTSLDGDFSISLGDLLSLCSGIFFAIHIVYGNYFGEQGDDAILLTTLQFGFAAILTVSISLFTQPQGFTIPSDAWLPLAYLAVFCTTVTLLLQNMGLARTNASTGALILSLEGVFGTFFSVLLGKEQLTLRIVGGFTIIFLAIVISTLPSKEKKSTAIQS